MSVRRRLGCASACLAVGVSAVGCTSPGPRFKASTSVEAYCGSKQARLTGVASVVTSTNDVLLSERPTATTVERAVRAGDGVIVRWNDQLLALPHVSRQLGETDGYARVRAAAIPPAELSAEKRTLYLLVRDHARQRWIALEAFDVQNVCVEGKPQS